MLSDVKESVSDGFTRNARVSRKESLIYSNETRATSYGCPPCRDQIQAKQPKDCSLTKLRKDMEEANRRLTSQLEAFQERLLKKVEAMMHRGPEVRDIQATQPYRSPVIRTTKRKPPPEKPTSDTIRH
jgi:hypothetical protein